MLIEVKLRHRIHIVLMCKSLGNIVYGEEYNMTLPVDPKYPLLGWFLRNLGRQEDGGNTFEGPHRIFINV